MGFVDYNKIEVGDSRSASGINDITSKVSTESANIQRLNLKEGGVDSRNMVSYAARRTAKISSSSSAVITTTGWSTVSLGGVPMEVDFSSKWGSDVILQENDAMRITVSAELSGSAYSAYLTIMTKINGTTSYSSSAARRMEGIYGVSAQDRQLNSSVTTILWVQPEIGIPRTVEKFGIGAKVSTYDSSLPFEISNACVTATVFRNIGRL